MLSRLLPKKRELVEYRMKHRETCPVGICAELQK
jgi:hypothetical protein